MKFQLAEINLKRFLFLSTYQKECELDWNEKTIKLYSIENENSLILDGEFKFEKANKYLIIFLKFIPFVVVFLLSFRIPYNFELNSFDFSKLISLAVAIVLVYLGYRLIEKKVLLLAILAISYISLFLLSLNFSIFIHLNRNLITSLFFIWSIKEMYFTYIRGYFDDYYVLRNSFSGYFMRIVE